MRLKLDPRARAFVRRMPRTSVYGLGEMLLLVLLAVQCARLLWVLVTPVSPLGDWRPSPGVVSGDPAQAARLRAFDPFFRLVQEPGTATLTSLQLKLYGVRVDEATGRGSAILAGPDEVQTSYAVGDEVLPGVILSAVAYDHVTLSRGGTEEELYIDQSTPAPVVDPSASGGNPLAAPPVAVPPAATDPRRAAGPTLSIEALRRDVRFQPRVVDGRPSGVTVSGGGATLGVVGLADGDVVVEANGRAIGSSADVEALVAGARPGGSIELVVERGGERVPVSVPVGQ